MDQKIFKQKLSQTKKDFVWIKKFKKILQKKTKSL